MDRADRQRCFDALRSTILAIAMCAAGPAAAQSIDGGGRIAGLARAGTALTGEVWGFANPATWVWLHRRAVSFFATQDFGFAELRMSAIQYVEPTSAGAFGLGARTYGYEQYRDSQFAITYANGLKLGSARAFGVALDVRYTRLSVAGYGANGAVGLSVGWIVDVNAVLQIGAYATNLNVPKVGSDAPLARTLSTGVHYRPTVAVSLLLDAYKDVRFPASIRTAIEIRPIRTASVRAGISTRPTQIAAGLGFSLRRLRADIAAQRHYALGWSFALAATILG